jgi:O-antigen chain-terminating methyltransferase
LLNFLALDSGFYKSKILRLQESKSLSEANSACLFEVLAGASPDYALLAIKGNDTDYPKDFWIKFEVEFGLSLETLSSRYDRQVHEIQDIKKSCENEFSNLGVKLEKVETRLDSLAEEYSKLLNSRSWRLTAPLRQLANKLRILKLKFLN